MIDMPGYDVIATDGLSIIGTLGFFVPAAILVALVAGAVVRDRRLSAHEAAAEAEREGIGEGTREGIREDMAREALPGRDAPTPPRAD